MNWNMVIEAAIVVPCVIGLVYSGIFIGREFGSFEKFLLFFLERMEKSLEKWQYQIN